MFARRVTIFPRRQHTPAPAGVLAVPGKLMPIFRHLAFTWAVYDAAHDRHGHFFHADIFFCAKPAFPNAGMTVCFAPIPETRYWLFEPQPGQAVTIGVNARKPMVWQDLRATTTSCVRSAAGSGVTGDAYGVADAFLQQHRKRGGRRNDALGTCPPSSDRGARDSRSAAPDRGTPRSKSCTPLTLA